jgi:DNA processing protein
MMEKARYELKAVFEAIRGSRGLVAKFPGLWCAGSLEGLDRPCIAIVGTRSATPYGRRLAHEFARDLAAAGCCIVSGLALGIDTSAHEGALAGCGPTVGVLGGGHDRFFPRRNAGLASRMVACGGAVLSPFPPEHPALPGQFLERNGVVAALSDAIVVIEAPERSGALNTASWASGHIPVLAVPGDVDRRHVAGCLALIRDGAILARNAGDVLEVLRLPQLTLPLAEQRLPSEVAGALGATLLALLDDGECDLDALVSRSGARAGAVLSALVLLELEGSVERRGAARYARLR